MLWLLWCNDAQVACCGDQVTTGSGIFLCSSQFQLVSDSLQAQPSQWNSIDRLCNNYVKLCHILQYANLAHVFGLLWEGLMAVYWLISATLLADLFRQYCKDDDNSACEERERIFLTLPILGLVCMVGWVSWCSVKYLHHNGHNQYILIVYDSFLIFLIGCNWCVDNSENL